MIQAPAIGRFGCAFSTVKTATRRIQCLSRRAEELRNDFLRDGKNIIMLIALNVLAGVLFAGFCCFVPCRRRRLGAIGRRLDINHAASVSDAVQRDGPAADELERF